MKNVNMSKTNRRLFVLLLVCACLLSGFTFTRSASANDQILVTFTSVNSWQQEGKNCYQYSVSMQNNTSTAQNGWKMVLDTGEKVTIHGNWNSIVYQADTQPEISNVAYNGSLPAGGKVTDIGVIIGVSRKDPFSGTYVFDRTTGELTKIDGGAVETDPAQPETEKETKAAEPTQEVKPTEKETEAQPTRPSYEYDASTAGKGTGMYGDLLLNGVDLCNAAGTPVQLCGVSTHGIAWFPEYVNEETFRTLRDEWGVNLIRLAMYTREEGGYCNDGDKAALEAIIDRGVRACINLHMYCIIDWHILSDGNPNTYLTEAKDFFNRMSAKYGAYNNVLYEICNEPNGGTSWGQIKSYADQVIPIIRSHAPNAMILVGTPTWSQDIDQVANQPVADRFNVMYTLHFYAATHGDWLRQRLSNARNAGTPVFISEFSICDASGNGAVDYYQAQEWKNLIEGKNLSFAGWNLSNKNESSSLIASNCTKISGWQNSELSETGKWLKQLVSGNSIIPDEIFEEPTTEEETESDTEPDTEPVTEPVEVTTEEETEPDTEPVEVSTEEETTEPETEPATEPATEPVEVSSEEETTEPETEPATEPDTEPVEVSTEEETTTEEEITTEPEFDYEDATMFLPTGLAEIEEEAFYGTPVQKVVIPDGTARIGTLAFAYCEHLQVVVIPDSVTEIAEDAFQGSNVTIWCSEDSPAAQYAKDSGIPMKAK